MIVVLLSPHGGEWRETGAGAPSPALHLFTTPSDGNGQALVVVPGPLPLGGGVQAPL